MDEKRYKGIKIREADILSRILIFVEVFPFIMMTGLGNLAARLDLPMPSGP